MNLFNWNIWDLKAMYTLVVWIWKIKFLDQNKALDLTLEQQQPKNTSLTKVKEIERELKVIQEKKQFQVTFDNLLGD